MNGAMAWGERVGILRLHGNLRGPEHLHWPRGQPRSAGWPLI